MNSITINTVTSKIGSGATPIGGDKSYKKNGISLIRSQNVLDFQFSKSGLAFIDEIQARELDNVTVQEGDILLNITGDSIARCCIVPNEILPARVNQHVSIVRAKNINYKYLFYYLQYLKPYLLKICRVGGTRNALTKESISDLPFFPNLKQDLIANTLYSIDKKIQNNNTIIKELEAMAKTLYDYWFVQFDFPNENGKPYKSTGGAMMYNEELKREIPEGWEVSKLDKFIATEKGGDWGKEEPQGNYTLKVKCMRGADFPSIHTGICNAPTRYILEKNEEKILAAGDVIVEISGGSPTQSTGRICYINAETIERFDSPIITSNFCKAFSIKELHQQYWFYLTWKQLYDNNVLFGFEGKTTGIKNLLFDDFVTGYSISVPSDKVLKKFNELIKKNYKKIQLINIENDKLASLRDWLLPMLMNGQATMVDDLNENSQILDNDERFVQWKNTQGLAARGDVDEEVLRDIFNTIHKDDR